MSNEEIALELTLGPDGFNTTEPKTNPFYRGAMKALQYKEAENKRLREALEKIVNYCESDSPSDNLVILAIQIATEALKTLKTPQ